MNSFSFQQEACSVSSKIELCIGQGVSHVEPQTQLQEGWSPDAPQQEAGWVIHQAVKAQSSKLEFTKASGG